MTGGYFQLSAVSNASGAIYGIFTFNVDKNIDIWVTGGGETSNIYHYRESTSGLELTSVSPSTLNIGQSYPLTCSGKGFSTNCRIIIGGQTYTPSSSGSLSAVTSVIFNSTGIFNVTIKNSNGEESNPKTITVISPEEPPDGMGKTRLLSISPTIFYLNNKNAPITATGTEFDDYAQICAVNPKATAIAKRTGGNHQTITGKISFTVPGNYLVHIWEPTSGENSDEELPIVVLDEDTDPDIDPSDFRLDSISPVSYTSNVYTPFTAMGAGFKSGLQMFARNSQAGTVAINVTQVSSSSKITGNIQLVALGQWFVWVHNPDGENTLEKLIMVVKSGSGGGVDPPTPTDEFELLDVRPREVIQDTTNYIDFTILGKGFNAWTYIQARFSNSVNPSTSLSNVKLNGSTQILGKWMFLTPGTWFVRAYRQYPVPSLTSKEIAIAVIHKIISLSSISPSRVTYHTTTKITVKGGNIQPTTALVMAPVGTENYTTFATVSRDLPTQLIVQLYFGTLGVFDVYLLDTHYGVKSNRLQLVVAPPPLVLTSVTPELFVQNEQKQITAYGTGFVNFNQTYLRGTLGSTTVTVSNPTCSTNWDGRNYIIGFITFPRSGTWAMRFVDLATNRRSDPINVTVYTDDLHIDSIDPNTYTLEQTREITIKGTGFLAASTYIRFYHLIESNNYGYLSTGYPSYRDPTTLKYTTSFPYIGEWEIYVINYSNNKVSNHYKVTVENKPLQLTSVSPTKLKANIESYIYVYGQGFDPNIDIRAIGSTTITIDSMYNNLTYGYGKITFPTYGTWNIRVVNTDGEVSNPIPITVEPEPLKITQIIPNYCTINIPTDVQVKGSGIDNTGVLLKAYKQGEDAVSARNQTVYSYSNIDLQGQLQLPELGNWYVYLVNSRQPGSPVSNILSFYVYAPSVSIFGLISVKPMIFKVNVATPITCTGVGFGGGYCEIQAYKDGKTIHVTPSNYSDTEISGIITFPEIGKWKVFVFSRYYNSTTLGIDVLATITGKTMRIDDISPSYFKVNTLVYATATGVGFSEAQYENPFSLSIGTDLYAWDGTQTSYDNPMKLYVYNRTETKLPFSANFPKEGIWYIYAYDPFDATGNQRSNDYPVNVNKTGFPDLVLSSIDPNVFAYYESTPAIVEGSGFNLGYDPSVWGQRFAFYLLAHNPQYGTIQGIIDMNTKTDTSFNTTFRFPWLGTWEVYAYEYWNVLKSNSLYVTVTPTGLNPVILLDVIPKKYKLETDTNITALGSGFDTTGLALRAEQDGVTIDATLRDGYYTSTQINGVINFPAIGEWGVYVENTLPQIESERITVTVDTEGDEPPIVEPDIEPDPNYQLFNVTPREFILFQTTNVVLDGIGLNKGLPTFLGKKDVDYSYGNIVGVPTSAKINGNIAFVATGGWQVYVYDTISNDSTNSIDVIVTEHGVTPPPPDNYPDFKLYKVEPNVFNVYINTPVTLTGIGFATDALFFGEKDGKYTYGHVNGTPTPTQILGTITFLEPGIYNVSVNNYSQGRTTLPVKVTVYGDTTPTEPDDDSNVKLDDIEPDDYKIHIDTDAILTGSGFDPNSALVIGRYYEAGFIDTLRMTGVITNPPTTTEILASMNFPQVGTWQVWVFNSASGENSNPLYVEAKDNWDTPPIPDINPDPNFLLESIDPDKFWTFITENAHLRGRGLQPNTLTVLGRHALYNTVYMSGVITNPNAYTHDFYNLYADMNFSLEKEWQVFVLNRANRWTTNYVIATVTNLPYEKISVTGNIIYVQIDGKIVNK